MKGKVIAIGVVVVTLAAIIAIYFLVMATFNSDERSFEDVSVSDSSVMKLANFETSTFM